MAPGLATESYGLSFDSDAMLAWDIEDRMKFYSPNGRFYVIRRDDAHVGVGCLKRITPSAGSGGAVGCQSSNMIVTKLHLTHMRTSLKHNVHPR